MNLDAHYVPEPNSGCFLWIGAVDRKGYGLVRRGHVNWRAHRLSWTLANGPIPAGMLVCHHCDTPSCVNPQHLFIGTHTDNEADKRKKGRHTKNLQPRCRCGREMLGVRTCSGRPHRYCRPCNTEKKRLQKAIRAKLARGAKPSIVVRRRAATHCKNGHPWNAENTYWDRGTRSCRMCNRAAVKRYEQKRYDNEAKA